MKISELKETTNYDKHFIKNKKSFYNLDYTPINIKYLDSFKILIRNEIKFDNIIMG